MASPHTIASPGHRSRWHVLLTASLLALVGCTVDSAGAPTTSPAGAATQPPVSRPSPGTSDSSDTTWNALAAPLGQTITFDSGLTVQITAPVRVTPSRGADGANDRQIHVSLLVTVTNGQPDAFDIAHLVATASTGSDATSCRQMRDPTSGLGDRAPTRIASGAKARFTIGYSCPGEPGDALVVEVTPRSGFANGQFSGSLP